MKPKEVERILLAEGWYRVSGRGKGSHRHYRHPVKRGTVTLPWQQGEDLRAGTLHSMLTQAGLK
jgi:predicted RNA binding protein YcfA (HicA-like mRNA interferase family)